MNTPNENDIIEALKTDRYRPSLEWRIKTLQKLRAISAAEPSREQSFLDLFLNFIQTKKPLKMAVATLAAAAIVLVISNFAYNKPAARAQRHLKNAVHALEQLERYTRGESVSMIQSVQILSLVPAAYAEGAVPAKSTIRLPVIAASPATEAIVQKLILTAVAEIEKAIQAAEDIGAPAETAQILSKIYEIQDTSVKTFSSVASATSSAETARTAVTAIETTAAEQASVTQALEIANKAAAAGSAKVKIDVPTGKKLEQAPAETKPATSEQAKERLESARDILSRLDAYATNKEETKEEEDAPAMIPVDAGITAGIEVSTPPENPPADESDSAAQTETPDSKDKEKETEEAAESREDADAESPQAPADLKRIREEAYLKITEIQKMFGKVKIKILADENFDFAKELADAQARVDALRINYDKAVSVDIFKNEFFSAAQETLRSIDTLDKISNLMRAEKQIDDGIKNAEEIIAKLAEDGMDTSELQAILARTKAEAEALKVSLKAKPLELAGAVSHLDILNILKRELEDEINNYKNEAGKQTENEDPFSAPTPSLGERAE